ncbi:macrophage mannose receptor 1-like [Sardina pilchardus]|uniref:macrophage mannose receptor 1-like n=1 Tax=Sardina pilchardus TaxID=27697 RepID=UPI002E0D4317
MTTLLVSGLGSLSFSVPRQFHVVEEQKNWTEAQQYCREEFTDLATIDDMTENEKVQSMIHEAGVNAWIGLKKGSSPKWQWSLADRHFYRENETEFRSWATGQPDGGGEECGFMRRDGKWYDYWCSVSHPFICYDDNLVLVRENKNWREALQYCREHHVDLVSVTSERVQRWVSERAKGASTAHVWVGLLHCYSLGWYWVSGQNVSYSNWAPGYEQVGSDQHRLGAVESRGGQWVSDLTEADQLNFICTTEDSKEIKQRLRDSGMPADAKLTWMTQPDGKIFKEKEEKKEEGRKRTEL